MKLGLISDVQYCDCDNAWNYEKTSERFYRNSINHLDNALNYFIANKCDKVLQLGDLIDGKCRMYKNFDSASKLIAKRFDNGNLETFHVTGNHELYNFSRNEFCDSFLGKSMKKYQHAKIDLNYYKVELTSKIVLIVLDTYEISVLNRRKLPDPDLDYLAGKKILTENNGNESWNEPIGAKKAKYVAFNGGIGTTQLEWLKSQLTECSVADQIVLIAGHIPLIGSYPNPLCLMWNDEEVLEVITKFPCVKAYICGHEHDYSFVKTDQFVQITMPGIIEAKSESRPYGIMEIDSDKLTISDMPEYWPKMQFIFDNDK